MNQLSELLEPYKQKQDVSTLYVLRSNLPAMKILAMWPYIKVEWIPSEDEIPEDEPDVLSWIWQDTLDSVDYHTLSAGANISLPKTVDLVHVLATMKLIYPDNTIATCAKEFLEKSVPKSDLIERLNEDNDE